MPKNDYSRNVFINCPFDEKYNGLREAMIFAISYAGFNPRCALEENNSGNIRFSKILKIIEESAYGIHDLSRTELDKNTNLPRFNMPLELGVFLGATHFGNQKQKRKKCLILGHDQYPYQKYISDISGHDIEAHQGKHEAIIKHVSTWLRQFKRKATPGPKEIIKQFNEFKKALPIHCKKEKIEVNELTFNDHTRLINRWLRTKAKAQEN